MDLENKNSNKKIYENLLKKWFPTKHLYEQFIISRARQCFRYISDEFKTAKICELAIYQDALNLQYVPNHLKTPELCLLAVTRNGLALEFVPLEYKNFNLCMSAISNNKKALNFAGNKFGKISIVLLWQTLEFSNIRSWRVEELLN